MANSRFVDVERPVIAGRDPSAERTEEVLKMSTVSGIHRLFSDRFGAALLSSTLRRSRALLDDTRGAVSVALALVSPLVIGGIGLAAEASYWQMHQRAMQNAADSAAIAAAAEGSYGVSDYATVGQAVAAQYGFVNGGGNVSVTVTKSTTAAGCASSCYTASITDQVPLFLSPVVGFKGTTTVNSQPMTQVDAGAVATESPNTNFCILALATSGATGISTNGAPNANLQGAT